MDSILDYNSDSSDAENEKGETSEDFNAHLKPIDSNKKLITTVALNAAPAIATKARTFV